MVEIAQALLNANGVLTSIKTVFSFLVWQPALVGLLLIGYRSLKRKEFIATLPLLAALLNMAFIWICTACI